MAGAAQLGNLAVVLAGGPAPAAVALVAVGVLVGLLALAPPVLAAVSARRGWIVFALLVVAVAWRVGDTNPADHP